MSVKGVSELSVDQRSPTCREATTWAGTIKEKYAGAWRQVKLLVSSMPTLVWGQNGAD